MSNLNNEVKNTKYTAISNLAQAHLINITLADFYLDHEAGKKIAIDPYDLILLDLVKDICTNRKMEKITIVKAPKDYLINLSFTKVKYENIINQVPLLKLNSTVSVSRRIQKLVQLGLVDKVTIPNKKEGGKSVYIQTTELADILYTKVGNSDDEIKEVINSCVNRLLTDELTTYLTDGLIRLLYNKTTSKQDYKEKKEKKEKSSSGSEQKEGGAKEKAKYSKKEQEFRDLLAELKSEIKHKSKVAFTKKAFEEFKLMNVPVAEIKKTALAHYADKGEFAVVIAKLLLDYDGIVASLAKKRGNGKVQNNVDAELIMQSPEQMLQEGNW